ncbi:hypothetical protein GCM10023329_33840 [Streptomyces sanyensis]|uniref:Uncharacterized protein n=1 Tax=Streptomyces sanyensis TaxID=568869 RepID=A0ABP9AIC5_9ACTN
MRDSGALPGGRASGGAGPADPGCHVRRARGPKVPLLGPDMRLNLIQSGHPGSFFGASGGGCPVRQESDFPRPLYDLMS